MGMKLPRRKLAPISPALRDEVDPLTESGLPLAAFIEQMAKCGVAYVMVRLADEGYHYEVRRLQAEFGNLAVEKKPVADYCEGCGKKFFPSRGQSACCPEPLPEPAV